MYEKNEPLGNTLSHGSILSFPDRGPWGDHRYPGNCSGYIYKTLFAHLKPVAAVARNDTPKKAAPRPVAAHQNELGREGDSVG